MRIQLKPSITWNRKVIHAQRIQQLIRLNHPRRDLGTSEFGETVGDEEDEDNEETIGRALDLEVAEEGVGAEEVEGLVDDVCGGEVGCKDDR